MKKFFQSVWSVIKKIFKAMWKYILIFASIVAILEWVRYMLIGGSKPTATQKLQQKAKDAVAQSKQTVADVQKQTQAVDANVAQVKQEHKQILDTEAKRDTAAKEYLPNLKN